MAVTRIKHTNKHKKISSQLAIATSSLLAADHTLSADDEDSQLYGNWNVDVGYLYYEEPEYIKVNTYTAKINGSLSSKDTINLGLVFDTLSGATPTGALPDSQFVSVSGVSGGGVSGAGGGAGKVAFDDTRLAFDATWGHEWERLVRSNITTYVSVEGDYTAIGGSVGIEKDSKDRSNTYSAALGLSTDRIGRSDETTPAPLTEVSAATYYDTGSRSGTDLMIGMTTVLNRRTVGMLNITYSHSLGYHTDPYKIISIADDNDVELTTVFEKRPDERERFIVYGKIKHELPSNGHHLGLSYRLHTDSWGVNSHTLETSYSITLNNGHKLEPFTRLYRQQAANFYSRTINYTGNGNFASLTLPNYASADVRLGEMFNSTLGLKYIHKTSAKGSIDSRIGYYHRNFSNASINDDGAFFVQVDFSKGFD